MGAWALFFGKHVFDYKSNLQNREKLQKAQNSSIIPTFRDSPFQYWCILLSLFVTRMCAFIYMSPLQGYAYTFGQ